MKQRIAINGFGRIGRQVFRILHNDPQLEIVAINDLTDPEMLAHLLRYDSVHGRFDAEVKVVEGGFEVDGRFVKVTAERNPAALPWGELGVKLVHECTGVFRSREKAAAQQAASAKLALRLEKQLSTSKNWLAS